MERPVHGRPRTRVVSAVCPNIDPVYVRGQGAHRDLTAWRRRRRGGAANRGVVGAAAHVGLEDHLVAALAGASRGGVAATDQLAARVHDREPLGSMGDERAGDRAERRLLDRAAADAIGAEVLAEQASVANVRGADRVVLDLTAVDRSGGEAVGDAAE